ncbi:MAG: DUF4157 domain-containing protein, partial [Bacteroidia bacterium]|nr:DUF4157 domain-containing protein [Bacteroidia bacterium]
MKAKQTRYRTQPRQQQEAFFGGAKACSGSFFGKTGVQAKLSIGQPGDKFEQEADAVADRVVSGMSASPVLSTAGAGLNRKCAECEQEESVQRVAEEEEELQMKAEEEELLQMQTEEEEEPLQAKGGEGGMASDAFASRLQSRSGMGQTLDAPVQQQMEQSIGADFSGVRVHTDSEAVQMS